MSPPVFMPPHRGLRLALLAAAQFVVALDYNVVYVALPDIGRGLGFTAQSLQWVVSSYAVAFGGLLMLGGRLVDRVGQRRMFVSGVALFAVSCLAGGLATDSAMLLTARGTQGLGAAMLTPATLSLVNTGFAEGPERTRALSLWSAAGSAGLAAGALLGGVLTQAGGWRWVMLVMVPPAAAIASAAPRLLPREDRVRRGTEAGFDVPGALVVTIGATLLVFGLAGGPQAGWGSLRSAGSVAVGAMLLCAFVLVERRARAPLVSPRLLRNRGLAVAMAVILLFQSALGGAYYTFTTYLQDGHGYSALATGLAFLPVTILSVVGGMKFGPRLIARWGVRPSLFVSMLVNGTGITVLALGMSPGGSFWSLLPGIVVWGTGGGMAFTAMFVTAASGVAPPEQGIASAMATTAQQLGGAAGLALLIAIVDAGSHTVGGRTSSADLINGLRHAGMAGGTAAILGAFLAFALERRAKPAAPHDPVPRHESTVTTITTATTNEEATL